MSADLIELFRECGGLEEIDGDTGEDFFAMTAPALFLFASRIRAKALEEAADILDAMNDSAGDRAAYDNREMYDHELDRMHAISDCARAIRSAADPARESEAQQNGGQR